MGLEFIGTGAGAKAVEAAGAGESGGEAGARGAGGSRAEDGGRASSVMTQPFTAPAARPLMNQRCDAKNVSSTGMTLTTAAAIIRS